MTLGAGVAIAGVSAAVAVIWREPEAVAVVLPLMGVLALLFIVALS